MLRTWGFMLPLVLGLVSCEWNPWGDDDAPEAGYYQIPAESLAGWDKGVCHFDGRSTTCDYYIVSGTDSVDGAVTVCLNAGNNREVGKAMTFHLTANADVLKATVAGLQFNGLSCGEEVEFTVYDSSGGIAGHFTVPYMMTDATASPQPSSARIMDFDRFTDEAWKFIADSLQTQPGLDEAMLRNAVADYLSGGIEGENLTTFKGQILPAESIANLLQEYYGQEMARCMGSADIEITSVTQTSDTTVTVEGRIANISSIPASRQTVHDGTVCEVGNKVLYGVAVGRTLFPSLQVCEASTDLAAVSEEHFSLTVNIGTKPGKNYYFRPFLIPEHKVQNEMELLPDGYIGTRYGDTAKFMNMNLDIELSKFKQIKCVRYSASYDVQFTIEGKIPYLFDDMENWGFIVRTRTDSYAMSYYARELEWYDMPTEKRFSCNLLPLEADITEYGVDRMAEFTITPFVEFKGSQPLIVNLETKNYTLIVGGGGCPDTNHPHAIDLGLSVKWSCCNVDDGIFAWGETETKRSYTADSYNYVKDLDGDENFLDDDANWIDIGTDISGTSYDAAHVRWGQGWRMPTFAEAMELYDECTWEWRESSRSYKVIGANGRNISMSSSYWIGTLSKEEGENCYAYYLYVTKNGRRALSWDYRYRGLRIRPVKE